MKVSKEDRTQVINFVQGEGVSTYYGYNPLPYLEVAGNFGSPLGPHRGPLGPQAIARGVRRSAILAGMILTFLPFTCLYLFLWSSEKYGRVKVTKA
jgi:hypothetical protein